MKMVDRVNSFTSLVNGWEGLRDIEQGVWIDKGNMNRNLVQSMHLVDSPSNGCSHVLCP